TAPDCFIGWRQNGAAICAALGASGSSFSDGTAIGISNATVFQWTLTYNPTGGDNGCGQITLTISGSSSTLSLTQDQRKALSANKFNRFGIVSSNDANQQASNLWLDNLIYTKVTGLP